MDSTEHRAPAHRGAEHPTEQAEDAHALSLQRALLALDAGRPEEAHPLLTRLLRGHTTDPEVVFPLALVRYRLGYRASAEALFSQAFDYGYIIHDTGALSPVDGHPLHVQWTDPSSTVRLILTPRPRSRAMRLIRVEPASAPTPSPQ